MSTPLIPKSPTFTPDVQVQIDDLRAQWERAKPGRDALKLWREIEKIEMRYFVGRRWFAMSALQGMLASWPTIGRGKIDKRKCARLAFEWADAMLAAEEESAK